MPFPFINQLVTSLHQIAEEHFSRNRTGLPAQKPVLTAQAFVSSQKATVVIEDPWTPDNYHYAG
jgi:hypothetical protein